MNEVYIIIYYVSMEIVIQIMKRQKYIYILGVLLKCELLYFYI